LAIDAIGTISSAVMAYAPNIADEIRERRAGTDIVGVIALNIDGRDHTLDVEVMTPHYRGAHGAAKSGSGFRLYFTAHAGRGRSGGRTPSVIEELL
jgi:hypothetical protein